MFRRIRIALSDVSAMSTNLQWLVETHQEALKHLKEPSALQPMQKRLDDMERELTAILGQAETILHSATRERKEARNAEERMRTKEKRVDEATEALEYSEDRPLIEPEFAGVVPQDNGAAGEEESLHPLRSRLEAKSEAKARARAHKFSA